MEKIKKIYGAMSSFQSLVFGYLQGVNKMTEVNPIKLSIIPTIPKL